MLRPRLFHLFLFVVFVLCIAVYLRSFYKQGRERELRRAWFEAVQIPYANSSTSFDEADALFLSTTRECPFCGGVLVLVPVSPSGDRIVTYGIDQPEIFKREGQRARSDRFYAYCPAVCKEGLIPFQFGDNLIFLRQNDVSWYFCKKADDLTNEERKMEESYFMFRKNKDGSSIPRASKLRPDAGDVAENETNEN